MMLLQLIYLDNDRRILESVTAADLRKTV